MSYYFSLLLSADIFMKIHENHPFRMLSWNTFKLLKYFNKGTVITDRVVSKTFIYYLHTNLFAVVPTSLGEFY